MKTRLFLTCWAIFSLHFATNVVREHYPAFALIEHGDFRLDEYEGFHADIFKHRDGHCYIGNQVTGSVIAAVPLLVFDPVLDRLEEVRKAQIAERGPPEGGYRTDKPKRREFFDKVAARGLDIRFGAATVVTSVFLMAPLSALFTVLVFSLLCSRGVTRRRALWLSILFAFATPVFFRTAHLSHNVFLMMSVFGAFLLLWPREGEDLPLSGRRRFFAGFLAGFSLALDYAGMIPLLCLFGYLLVTHARREGLRGAMRAAPAFILGSVPPVLFLLYTQWIIFGDPIKPGQLWMPVQNIYVNEGARGFTAPDAELFLLNLVDLDWGLFAFAPLLLVALVPVFFYRDRLVLPRGERVFGLVFSLAFMIFCAMNQYSRLQWNTGFRYLLPLVPFFFLAASDHLSRMKPVLLAAVSVPVLVHGFVLSMVRHSPGTRGEPQAVPESFVRIVSEGLQFPWLSVLKQTPTLPSPILGEPWLPYALLAACALFVAVVWWIPVRRKRGI